MEISFFGIAGLIVVWHVSVWLSRMMAVWIAVEIFKGGKKVGSKQDKRG